MITVVLAGKKKPTKPSDLGRLLGARKSMIRDIIDCMVDKDDQLVVGFPLAKSVPVGEENLDPYCENGAVPKVFLDSILTSDDPLNVRARASSSHKLSWFSVFLQSSSQCRSAAVHDSCNRAPIP